MAVRNTMDASTSQLTMLHRISSIVSSNLSLDEKLGEVIGLAVQASVCDACLVYLIDPVTHEIVLRASQAPHAPAPVASGCSQEIERLRRICSRRAGRTRSRRAVT